MKLKDIGTQQTAYLEKNERNTINSVGVLCVCSSKKRLKGNSMPSRGNIYDLKNNLEMMTRSPLQTTVIFLVTSMTFQGSMKRLLSTIKKV